MVKTACIIHYWGDRFKELGLCAKNSFKKFHPNVDLFHIHDKNEHTFKCFKNNTSSKMVKPGQRYQAAKELMEDRGYDKVIVLGADTITCAYLSEFMGWDEDDIIATFDYDYPLVCKRYATNFLEGHQHLNADVICFNGVKGIDAILEILKDPENTLHVNGVDQYGEQAALNEVFYDNDNGVSGKWAETPPEASFYVNFNPAPLMCCYNVRAKSTLFTDYRDDAGNRYYQYKKALKDKAVVVGNDKKPLPDHLQPQDTLHDMQQPWKPFLDIFTSKQGQLRTGDGRQIKVWHYCAGFGCVNDEKFATLINLWKNHMFNEDTKNFFRQHCDCGSFFPPNRDIIQRGC